MIKKIISGGQTGVDRAALDVALTLKIPCGGWCPKGRLAEDGPIDPKYPLRETPDSTYSQRTEWNVRDSDGTLILYRNDLSGGTFLTVKLATQYRKPHLILDLSQHSSPTTLLRWLQKQQIEILNVAGSRESGSLNIHNQTSIFLRTAFSLT